jgi:hypothetical protein
MAQEVEAPNPSPDFLSSIPGTHVVEGEETPDNCLQTSMHKIKRNL